MRRDHRNGLVAVPLENGFSGCVGRWMQDGAETVRQDDPSLLSSAEGRSPWWVIMGEDIE